MYIAVSSLLKVLPVLCGSSRYSCGALMCLQALKGSPECSTRMEVLAYQRYTTQSAVFVVEYVGKEHAKNLVTKLNKHYIISKYWEGTIYLGMNLDWDYERCEVHISTMDYVVEALIRFQHNFPQNRKINHTHT